MLEADSRGAKYQVNAKASGKTKMKVTVAISKAMEPLDTAQYTLDLGNMYTIGAFIKDKNDKKLTSDEVKELVASGKFVVGDSRTDSMIDLVPLSTGYFRMIGKNEGTYYILYEIGGAYASVKIDMETGVKQGGSAVRNTSPFINNIAFENNHAKKTILIMRRLIRK